MSTNLLATVQLWQWTRIVAAVANEYLPRSVISENGISNTKPIEVKMRI